MKKLLLILLMCLLCCTQCFGMNCEEPTTLDTIYACRKQLIHDLSNFVHYEDEDYLVEYTLRLSFALFTAKQYPMYTNYISELIKQGLIFNLNLIRYDEKVEYMWKDYYNDETSQEYYESIWQLFEHMNKISAVEQLDILQCLELKSNIIYKGSIPDYKRIDLYETYVLSFMRYTTNQHCFTKAVQLAQALASKTNFSKAVIIPQVVTDVTNTIKKQKGW